MIFWKTKTKDTASITLEVALKLHPDKVELLPVPEKPAVVPPNLSTKPKDKVDYCFGYVCSKKHVNSTFDSIIVDGYKERRACQTCGGLSEPASVKRTAEACWSDHGSYHQLYGGECPPDWRWSYYPPSFGRISFPSVLWTKHEFVHYLDKPKRGKKRTK